MGSHDSALARLPLLLVMIGLIGYLVSSYWHQQEQFKTLRQELNQTRKTLADQLNVQNEQMNQRYLATLKISEDLATLQTQVREVDKGVKSELATRAQADSVFDETINRLKNQQAEVVKNIAQLEMTIKEVREKQSSNEVIDKLRMDVDSLRRQLDSHIAKFVALQEQLIIRSAIGSPSPSGTPTPQPQRPSSSPVFPTPVRDAN